METATAAGTRDRFILLCALGLFGVVLLRTAWLCDDAYISYRTIDNLLNGWGLRWNVAERVQSYTHPLWLLLLSVVGGLTGELFYSSIFVSVVVSLAAVSVVGIGIGCGRTSAAVAILVLTCSKSFVDYSTSGLENPLTHLLLVIYLYLYLDAELTSRRVQLLALVAALAALNRLDSILIYLPSLAAILVPRGDRRQHLVAMLWGFAPLFAWELFSLLYYGFPFPNTAYAKLHTGLTRKVLLGQGWYYLLHTAGHDPTTFICLFLGLAAPALLGERRAWTIAGGVALYLCYVVWIGGDFMGGRMFSAPLLGSVVLLLRWLQRSGDNRHAVALGVATLLIGVLSPWSPIKAGPDYKGSGEDRRGIADERGFYYHDAGLLRASRADMPQHHWAKMGRKERDTSRPIVIRNNIGYYGHAIGPRVHVVDALTDALLARLPAAPGKSWRVGHIGRSVPAGYIATLENGVNKIKDPKIAEFYDALHLIIRGDLFGRKRLLAIAKMNLGAYDHLLPER